MTNAEARFNNSLRPRKPEGSLGRTTQDGHLDSQTAPELWTAGQYRLNVFAGPCPVLHLLQLTSTVTAYVQVRVSVLPGLVRQTTTIRAHVHNYRCLVFHPPVSLYLWLSTISVCIRLSSIG